MYTKIFSKATKSKKIHEALFMVENENGSISHKYAYNKEIDSPIVLASVTKMFTSACILKLYQEKKIQLDDKLSKYFDDSILSKLHIYKNKEYSYDLTIANLLFHTSGLPDDFEGGNRKSSKEMEIILNNDKFISFEETLEETKREKARFVPGKKAYYANINFDLLGLIIEKVCNLPLDEVFKQMIFNPLGMKHTYLYKENKDYSPYSYYKDKKIVLPKVIESSKASGGGISNLNELMIFIKAYFNGSLFDKELLKETRIFKRLQIQKGPIKYGGGYMKISLNGLNTCFMAKGSLLGHTGSTGSFVAYYPEKQMYFVGDFSQLAYPAKPIRFLMRLTMKKICEK